MGILLGFVYHHFAAKEDLLEAGFTTHL